MCYRNDLNFVSHDAVHDSVRKPVEEEAPTDVAIDEREALRLCRDGINALFESRLKEFGGHRVTSAIPQKRFSSLDFRALLDTHFPARHGLITGKNALARVVPACDSRATSINVHDSLSHFLPPGAFDVAW